MIWFLEEKEEGKQGKHFNLIFKVVLWVLDIKLMSFFDPKRKGMISLFSWDRSYFTGSVSGLSGDWNAKAKHSSLNVLFITRMT